MNPPRKHHFVPAFYLSQWAGTDGLVCEHRRVAPGKIVDRRKHPNATGYENNLYRVEGVPEEASQVVESQFMQVLDDQAAVALRMIVGSDNVEWTSVPRSAWTQFILSLRFRSPATVALLRGTMRAIWEAAPEEQRRDSPPGLASWSALSLVVEIIGSERVGTTIFGMKWGRLPLPHSSIPLLTSDRPIVWSPYGLDSPEAFIVLPVSPKMLFVAGSLESLHRHLGVDNQTDAVKRINQHVVQQARQLVWGIDASQLRFVQNRMSRTPDDPVLTEEQRQIAIRKTVPTARRPGDA